MPHYMFIANTISCELVAIAQNFSKQTQRHLI